MTVGDRCNETFISTLHSTCHIHCDCHFSLAHHSLSPSLRQLLRVCGGLLFTSSDLPLIVCCTAYMWWAQPFVVLFPWQNVTRHLW